MEKLKRTRDTGLKREHQKRYDEAITEFKKVIEAYPEPANENEVLLKGICLTHRASCYLHKEKLDEAQADTDAAIQLYKKHRPNFESLSPDQLKEDQLTPVLAEGLIRNGQILEARNLFLKALLQYSNSEAFLQDSEAKNYINALFNKVGIPEISSKDADLMPFTEILMHILIDVNLLAALNKLLSYLKEGPISRPLADKFEETNCTDIIYGVMNLYYESETIINICILILTQLADSNVRTVWNGFNYIRLILDVWNPSRQIVGNCTRLLRTAPQEVFRHIAENDLIGPLINAFKHNLDDEEIDNIFYVIYNVACNPSQIHYAAHKGIMDVINHNRSPGALMLLSKICMMNPILEEADMKGLIDWAFEFLPQNSDREEIVIATSILLSRSVLNEKENEKEKNHNRAMKIFDLLAPAVMKHSKSIEVIANAFATFALATRNAPEKIPDSRLIRLSSVLLAVNIAHQTIAQNIISFLYECATNGLEKQIMEIQSVVPTAMKVLQQYPTNQLIVERAVILAHACNHPNKKDLINAALQQFPTSKIIVEYLARIK